jgi:alpha/beta superfamily hydrolase
VAEVLKITSERAARFACYSRCVKQRSEPVEEVSGRWLVRAILGTVVLAAIALYCTIMLLFYQGQWQFVFSRRAPQPAAAELTPLLAAAGVHAETVFFDYTETGHARLEGWWIPAAPGTEPQRSLVVLVCPSTRKSPLQNAPLVQALHRLGAGVFLFDYRGFNAGDAGHPSEQKAYADGIAALSYLKSTRGISAQHVVLYGAEAGAAVAAHVALSDSRVAGLILENPQPSFVAQVRREQHIRMLPLSLIFQDRFAIDGLNTLPVPKLILQNQGEPEYAKGAAIVFNTAERPRQIVTLNASGPKLYDSPVWQTAVGAFLFSLTQGH